MKDQHRPLFHLSHPALYFICLTCLIFSSGCSSLIGTRPRVTFERISSQEDTLQQIQATPTRFAMPIEENQAAWERARFFLETYAGKGKIEGGKDTLTKISSSGFRYQFVRQFKGGEAHFQVFCTPSRGSRHSNSEALLNAKNVARFLKDGELEVSKLIVD